MYLLTLPLLVALTGTDTTVTVGANGKLELRNHEGPVTVTVILQRRRTQRIGRLEDLGAVGVRLRKAQPFLAF
jgi:predicted DNA-binding helix-hairpin-helix protein